MTQASPPNHPNTQSTDDLSGAVIGCAYRVMNKLRTGFSEKVYENALAYELRKSGITVSQQHRVAVHYDEIIVGEYVTDLLVNESILVELKVVRTITEEHVAQCINYLAATGLRLCLLLNFARSRVQVQRVVHGFA
jgi:GxxExxY protein